jgi:hypothetical protein
MNENQNQRSDGDSSLISSEDDQGDENDSIEARQTQEGQEDIAESLSSNGSDNGKGNGSGSGGGYSADCSSSDASTNDAAKGSLAIPANEMQQLRVGEGETKPKSKEKHGKKSKSKGRSSLSKLSKLALDGGDNSRLPKRGAISSISTPALPQWNGVRIQHPMDPRIDLSTVGHIQTSSLSVFPAHIHNGDDHNNVEIGPSLTREIDGPSNHAIPSIDQYMTLMEVSLECLEAIYR